MEDKPLKSTPSSPRLYFVTDEQIQAFVGPGFGPDLTSAINGTMERFKIAYSPRRVRYFMAQCAYESGSFRKMSENLVYTSASRIAQVWPTRFHDPDSGTGRGPLDARLYVRNPELLANTVYANRNGNRGPESGDGWNYRGRGPTHLTFSTNYLDASYALFGDHRLYDYPDRVAEFEDGFLTAGWFWETRDLLELADADQYTEVTRRINGASGNTLTRVVNERLPMLRRANQSFVW